MLAAHRIARLFPGKPAKALVSDSETQKFPRRQEMRFERFPRFCSWLLVAAVLIVTSCALFAQETTGGLQGTVKDTSGAVVAGAHVVVRGPALAGDKTADTESTGYYRFANLPPGIYSVEVTAKGFKVTKREGLNVEVGHLPTIDLSLEVGTAAEVVEVSGQAPVIDVTTNTNQTNLTSEALNDTPHGYSFQSVIQYAPMARNEPLAGGSAGMTGNSGGSLPGSAGNGLAVGFSIGGAADSESTYLVEGQDTENISGGASNANVPFQFIQEVQVKTSGIEAEHGGALGGVVNVVMKKGSNGYHGSFFGTYEADAMDGSPTQTLRYDPTAGVTSGQSIPTGFDNFAQTYSPKKDHFRIAQPGFTVGGPIVKDRLWFFLGFAPYYDSVGRTVNFGPTSVCAAMAASGAPCPNQTLGNQIFNDDTQQYFSTARLDATLTPKIRVNGSWLYQYSRASGVSLPTRDPIASEAPTFLNTSIYNNFGQYSHGLGYSSPNATYNIGADITLSPQVVATTRYGYFFTNYHDFGWPSVGSNLQYLVSGSGGVGNDGNPLPAALEQPQGTNTAAFDQSFTEVNASKHFQFDQDIAFFKSGWWGTHNIKGGYQLNHLSNVINQHGNIPLTQVYPGAGNYYAASTATGGAACATLAAEWGGCAGQYGYVTIEDFATVLKTPSGSVVPASDWNHALFVQDAWTVGHGLTLNLGLRVEKETLPAPSGIGVNISSINFSWSQKVEPRLGAAWGSRDGKMKIFGSYGVTNDVMKLLLAQTSWGAQGFENCSYPLGPDGTSAGFVNSDVNAEFNSIGRACPTGVATVGANFTGGAPSAALVDGGTGTSLIENVNLRPEEPVAPGVNPYRQHEFVAGWDYQINRGWAFEARYDRRRLDHVIEDASLADPNAFEIYTIVNPGQGVNKTLNGYANFLTGLGDAYGVGTAAFNPTGNFWTGSGPNGTCSGCPNNPLAVRNYDGLEFRLTKSTSHGFAGMFSYTWSRLYGNYTGLTTTDQIDGGTTGRNSPDTTRSFDEPFYYFADTGKSNNGPLPTDRPNALKGYIYYSLPWKSNTNTTTIGLFQVAYQGSPSSSYVDLGLAALQEPIEATYIFGRGKWVNETTDASGNITLGNPYTRRTPWYTQTDLNLAHAIKVNKNNEHQILSFNATLTNLLNQHAVTSYWGGFGSNWFNTGLFPDQAFTGAAFYQQIETGYNPQAEINSQAAGTCVFCQIFGVPLPLIQSSRYNQANLWQLSRNIRVGATFTF
jgi:hypothetical protein